jgi:flagellar assembly protein FliH
MSDDVLTPKENLTAYERWELPSFDSPDSVRVSGAAGGIKLPTAAEIEDIQQQAHEEGYLAGQQAGHEEGYQTGHQTGHQEGYAAGAEKAAAEAAQLAALVVSMGQAFKEVDQQVAQGLLNLSLELAQQMVHQVLKVNPESVLPVIREAISGLPHFNAGAHIVLQPDDAEIVRARMGEQLTHAGWKIFEDAKLSKGGVRIETANSQIDATVETRWKRITENLGQDSSWLKE